MSRATSKLEEQNNKEGERQKKKEIFSEANRERKNLHFHGRGRGVARLAGGEHSERARTEKDEDREK